jgi:hypothetical protein
MAANIGWLAVKSKENAPFWGAGGVLRMSLGREYLMAESLPSIHRMKESPPFGGGQGGQEAISRVIRDWGE